MEILNSINYLYVLFWSLVSVSGLVIGSLLGTYIHFKHSTIVKVTAFAAGILIAAATLELSLEAMLEVSSPFIGFLALLVGGLVFSYINSILKNKGAENRKRCGVCVLQPTEEQTPGSGKAILFGSILDSIPGSLILGLVLFTSGPQFTLIAAITLGNFPEALSASSGMKQAKRSNKWILGVWGGVALLSILFVFLGYVFGGSLSHNAVGSLKLFAAGALIAMVVETIIPEAADSSVKYVGLISVLGFGLLLMF